MSYKSRSALNAAVQTLPLTDAEKYDIINHTRLSPYDKHGFMYLDPLGHQVFMEHASMTDGYFVKFVKMNAEERSREYISLSVADYKADEWKWVDGQLRSTYNPTLKHKYLSDTVDWIIASANRVEDIKAKVAEAIAVFKSLKKTRHGRVASCIATMQHVPEAPTTGIDDQPAAEPPLALAHTPNSETAVVLYAPPVIDWQVVIFDSLKNATVAPPPGLSPSAVVGFKRFNEENIQFSRKYIRIAMNELGISDLSLLKADSLRRCGSSDLWLAFWEMAVFAVTMQPCKKWYGKTDKELMQLACNDQLTDADVEEIHNVIGQLVIYLGRKIIQLDNAVHACSPKLFEVFSGMRDILRTRNNELYSLPKKRKAVATVACPVSKNARMPCNDTALAYQDDETESDSDDYELDDDFTESGDTDIDWRTAKYLTCAIEEVRNMASMPQGSFFHIPSDLPSSKKKFTKLMQLTDDPEKDWWKTELARFIRGSPELKTLLPPALQNGPSHPDDDSAEGDDTLLALEGPDDDVQITKEITLESDEGYDDGIKKEA